MWIVGNLTCKNNPERDFTEVSKKLETIQRELLDNIETIPLEDDEPVFKEPWQAEVFALVVTLYEQRLFTWPEWAEILSQQISLAQEQGDRDLGDTYYNHWLSALERLLVIKELGTSAQLNHLYDRWDKAASATPHGQPIEI